MTSSGGKKICTSNEHDIMCLLFLGDLIVIVLMLWCLMLSCLCPWYNSCYFVTKPLCIQQQTMNSIGKDCNDLKKAYEECFNSWFSDKFLKGDKQDYCDSLFHVYRECVRKAVVDNKIGEYSITSVISHVLIHWTYFRQISGRLIGMYSEQKPKRNLSTRKARTNLLLLRHHHLPHRVRVAEDGGFNVWNKQLW